MSQDYLDILLEVIAGIERNRCAGKVSIRTVNVICQSVLDEISRYFYGILIDRDFAPCNQYTIIQNCS
jgi:hypothetical protein